MTLVEFLLARIAEDEYFGTHDYHLAKRWDAECDAKRRIVEGLVRAMEWDASIHEGLTSTAEAGERVLNYLALPYSDHPDYQQEWKP